jgi:hypothetical protein
MSDCEVSQFSMYDKSTSSSSSRFIPSMPTSSALGQIYIFKVVQHPKFWTHVDFLVS